MKPEMPVMRTVLPFIFCDLLSESHPNRARSRLPTAARRHSPLGKPPLQRL